jgi:ATP-binding cassette subfamily C protein CydC
LIDAEPEVRDPERSLPPPKRFDLTIHDLSFRYGPDEPLVLDGLHLTIAHGQHLALVGPSGSGKSTLVNLLTRFWDYREGEILLAGQPLRDYRQEDVRRIIAVVSQQTHLFNTTIRDNLRLAKEEAADGELIMACQKAQLHDFIETLPQGYGTFIGENGLLLSGGQRQRLSLARAILKDAPIVVLDEATAHLDAVTERAVMVALDEFLAGRTAIVIAHRRPLLAGCDRVLGLRDGRLTSEDATRL